MGTMFVTIEVRPGPGDNVGMKAEYEVDNQLFQLLSQVLEKRKKARDFPKKFTDALRNLL